MPNSKPGKQKPPASFVTNIRFTITLGWILVAVGLAAFVAFYYLTKDASSKDYFVFGSSLCGGLTAIGSFTYLGHNLHLQGERDRIARSFQQIDEACKPEFVKMRAKIEAFAEGYQQTAKDKIGVEIHGALHKDEEMRACLKTVLGRFEIIALAIRLNAVAEDPMRDILGNIVPKLEMLFREYIAYTNEKHKRNDIWCELRDLAKRWDGEDVKKP